MDIFLPILGCLIILFSILPLIRSDFWTFRVFEYPRIQKLALVILWIVLYISFGNKEIMFQKILFYALIINGIYLCWQIWPFTPLAKKQVYRAEKLDPDNQIAVMISNVYEDNVNYQGCLQVIHENDPDLVLLLETNHTWAKETESLDKEYPFQVKVPIDNTYGMLLFSKFKLHDISVNYLVEEEIPSIFCQVELPSGQRAQVFAVHPTPPVPNENPRSTERDKELLLVAKKAEKLDMPVIVIGDLNDVAWSYTTELFLKTSQLLDPRRGRGFYNTFHAKMPIMQFPLDHAFISADFKLISLRRLDNFDSDHFPIFVKVQYEKQAEEEQEDNQLEQTKADEELAEEKIHADT